MNILDKIIAYKKEEIKNLPEISEDLPKSDRNFFTALKKEKKGDLPKLIAEIKPASPVKGPVLPENYDAGEIAKDYENSGASAISVLTDGHFFQGSFTNLKKAKKSTKNTPILCKDFILSEKQIHLARKHGADTFLLIAQVLESEEIQNLLNEGRKYNMEALVEIANEEDVEKCLQTDAKIYGINNRELKDFSLDLGRTFRLVKKLPKDSIVASLSGFRGADVRLVREVADAVLVGTNIGKSLQLSPSQGELEGVQSEIIKNTLNTFLHPKPIIKLCGVRNIKDFERTEKYKVDMIGLNFVSTSKRCISEKVATEISEQKKYAKLVGVFQNQDREFVEERCKKYSLDFAQLSGEEDPEDFQNFPFPIIKGISDINSQQGGLSPCLTAWKKIADIFLFDGKKPGSGQQCNHEIFEFPPSQGGLRGVLTKPFLIAGGVTPENIFEILKKTGADGADTASGVEDETGEKWSEEKIKEISMITYN